ncbi:MAG TPA: acyltransferase [Prolixibacteraceae bacterium]|jgi:peptidoglycan/LPS O-acetylase OafA/YrhL|nr:acyltransferase [Prolixibacteraceae bacterium]
MTQLTGSSSPNFKLLGLDHLRALAISFVFIYHYGGMFAHPQWIHTIGTFGWTGVDLFFVLSGYLISSQLFLKIAKGKAISFREFFLKRFFRIIPAYLVVVVLYFSFPFLREKEALAPLWKYLTFTQNLGLDARYMGTFSHAWSLCIEEQFYLFLPLTLILLANFKAIKKGYILLVLLFVAGFLARLYSWNALVSPFVNDDNFWAYWHKWIYYPTNCRLDGLLTGVSIAAIFQFKPQLKNTIIQYGNQLLGTGLLLLTGAYFLCINQSSFNASIFGFPLVSLGYGLLIVGAISPTSFLYKFDSRVTGTIASLSYALYLTHKIIIHVTQELVSKLNISKDSTLMFLICLATCLLGALLMNRLIEKPFLRLRDKVLSVTKSGRLEELSKSGMEEYKLN